MAKKSMILKQQAEPKFSTRLLAGNLNKSPAGEQ